jgi:UbiD family decarboxylase
MVSPKNIKNNRFFKGGSVMEDDLRDWLEKVERMGHLKKIDGADWDLEIGCVVHLNLRGKQRPALLFDNIKGYTKGYRILACSNSNAATLGLTLNLPVDYSDLELSAALRQKLPEWEAQLGKFHPEVVESGPIFENVHSGSEVNLFEFPVPKWNELDGGRYIGTGHVVITQDADTGEVNLGTYRVQAHDEKTTALFAIKGKHGRFDYEKYHAKGKPCPVALSVGHHPLIYRVGGTRLPQGAEYQYAGAIRGKPIRVIREELTGLPIPADSEIVLVGWCPPGKTRMEGPFGEWTGYYGSLERPAPIIEIERVYHRNNPILLGSPPGRPPNDFSYAQGVVRSAVMHSMLERNGIPGVKGVWECQATHYQFMVVSIKQMYPGHAKRAASLVTNLLIQPSGRYVVVVDDDIDPTDILDVLWAIASRADPEKDIDIVRRCWSSALDPTIRQKTDESAFFNSRAIIDACKPYEWIDEFPKDVRTSPELIKRVKEKWKDLL